MPNSAWSSPGVGGPCPSGPLGRAPHRPGQVTALGGKGQTHIQHHLDVGAKQLLGGDDALRRAVNGGPVVHALEPHPLVGHLRRQREHLKSTGVGQQVAVPPREATQPTKLGHDIGAGSQHQVIGVAQHELRPQVGELSGGGRPDRAPGAHRHEHRSLEPTLRSGGAPGSGRAVGGCDVELQPHRSPPTVGPRSGSRRSRSCASPKERKR